MTNPGGICPISGAWLFPQNEWREVKKKKKNVGLSNRTPDSFNDKKYKRPPHLSLVRLLRRETNNKTVSLSSLLQWPSFILKNDVIIKCKLKKRRIFSGHTFLSAITENMANKIKESLRIFLPKIKLQDISGDRVTDYYTVLCLEGWPQFHEPGTWAMGNSEVESGWGWRVSISREGQGNIVP